MAASSGKAATLRTKIPDEQRQAVANYLQSQLVELIDLGLQAKQAHWNVVGPHFRSLHLQLDEMVEAYRGWTDEVAERLAAIGVPPDGQTGVVARSTALEPLPSGPIQDREVVRAFVRRVGEAAGGARERAERLGELDLVSQDLLIEVTQGLEKQLWMLHAQER